MLRFFKMKLCLFVSLLLCLCGSASGQNLEGFAEWRYADYTAEEDGKDDVDASHFTQKYSFLWNKTGLINAGHAGNYTLALGAEWTSVKFELDDESTTTDTFKALYKGDLLFAPGGLPFRLHAYSYDLRPATFETAISPVSDVSPYLQPGSAVITPDIISGYTNGQYSVTGVTLLAGIRNGSYLGVYRDLLSRYPRMLLDYREIYGRDVDAVRKSHFRDRNLAFVSLNKKDNWFHYRAKDFKDYEDSRADYEEQSIMLGTIDHTLERKWINLTNWLEISVDGTYTKTMENFKEGETDNSFDLNLFSIGTRGNWTVSNFNSFSRSREGDNFYSKRMVVPFYANGQISLDTSWRAQLIADWDRTSHNSSGIDLDDDYIFARTKFKLRQRSRFIIQPEAAISLRQGDRGEGGGADVGVQVFSNYRYRPKDTLFGSLHFSILEGDGADKSDVSYVETRFVGRASRILNPKLTVGVEQRLLVGDGTLDSTVAPGISVAANQPLLFSATNNVVGIRYGTTVRSTSTIYAEHVHRRMKNRVEALFDILDVTEDSDKPSAESGSVFNLRHRLDYDAPEIRAVMHNDFIWGDDHKAAYMSSNYIGSIGNDITSSQWSFMSRGSVEYAPAHNYEASVDYQLFTNDNDIQQARITESLSYHLYTVNGRVRRLGSLYQELTYEKFSGIGNDPSVTVFTLGGNYYPNHYLSFGASLEHQYYGDGDFGQTVGKLSADLNFPKLVVGMDYSYGVRDEVDNYGDRDEQRWELRIKKVL